VEDALSGVEAGDRGEFAMVIGVDRADHAVDLSSHGATLVVHDLGEITVKPAPRPTRDQLPSAVDHLQDLLHELGASEPVVFLDYDGTLTPIVEHPDLALLDDETRAVITDLASVVTVAVLSGRDVLDVQDKMQVPGIYYAGSHGFDIIDPSGRAVEHDRMSRFRRYLGPLDQVAERLEAELRGVPGSQVERKRFAVAVHFRRVAETDLTRVERSVRETARDFPQLRISTGKKVLELRPDFDWDKGRALTWLLSQMGPDPMLMTPIYIGDDDTDEDAFSVIRRLGIGVVVGREREPTCARWALENTSEVREFLAACSARWKRAR
jgi:trehalose-phosphatase